MPAHNTFAELMGSGDVPNAAARPAAPVTPPADYSHLRRASIAPDAPATSAKPLSLAETLASADAKIVKG